MICSNHKFIKNKADKGVAVYKPAALSYIPVHPGKAGKSVGQKMQVG